MPRATRSRKPLADAEPVAASESPVKITKTKKKPAAPAAAPLKPSTRSANPPLVTAEPTKPPTKSTRARSAATANPTPSSSDPPAELPPAPPPQKKTRAKVPKRSLAPRPVAARTPSTRSTRRTTTESTIKNTSPKPAPEIETIQEAPSTPTKPKALPSPIEEEAPKEVSVSPAQSSNAENRTPAPAPAPPSSPPLQLPLRQSTPKTTHPTGLDFSSGAGYTPPPVLNSTERPRLHGLEPRTLLPIDSDSESAPGLPSPTPKRRNARPAAPVNAHTFTIAGETFNIYSDENNPRSLPATPSKAAADAEELSGTQVPPVSDTPTPRKRAPSAEPEGEETVVESPKRRKTRGVEAKKKQPAVLKTEELKTEYLKDLMPARKRVAKKVGKAVFDMSSDENEDSNSEDELSRSVRRGKGKRVAVAKGKERAAAKAHAAAKSHAAAVKGTKNAWSKPLSRAAPKTYSRRTRQDTQEAEEAEQEKASSELTPPPPSSSDATVEIGDGEVNHLGRRKLKEMRQKFQEVDKWEMEFETVSDK